MRIALQVLRTVVFVSTVVAWPTFVFAQAEGRVSVGGSVTLVTPRSDDVSRSLGVGALIRLNPRRGWGLAGALNWFAADLKGPESNDAAFARLTIRPLMGGISYTVGPDTTLVSFSVVGGPSFNSADFKDEFLRSQRGNPVIDVENSLVIRPGVSVTHSVSPRVGIVGFAGYMFNRPDVTYRNTAGQQFQNRWHADALVLSIGGVYSLF